MTYQTATFCEKNKDQIHTEAEDLIKASALPLLTEFFKPTPEEIEERKRKEEEAKAAGNRRRRGGGGGLMSKTLGTQFKYVVRRTTHACVVYVGCAERFGLGHCRQTLLSSILTRCCAVCSTGISYQIC